MDLQIEFYLARLAAHPRQTVNIYGKVDITNCAGGANPINACSELVIYRDTVNSPTYKSLVSQTEIGAVV